MRSKVMWQHLDGYWEAIQRSPLAEASKVDYYYFAECFVRWIEGDYEPGAKVERNKDNGS